MTIPEQAVEAEWPTHCIHGRSVNGPEWCPDCKRMGLDPEVTDVAWKILQALHENVSEAERPMSWSDVNGDQEQRIRAAAVAAIETIRTRDAQSLVGVQRPEDVARAICVALYPHSWDRCCNFNLKHEKCNNGIRWGQMLTAAHAVLALLHAGQPGRPVKSSLPERDVREWIAEQEHTGQPQEGELRQIALDAAERIIGMSRERDSTCELKYDASDCLSEGADEIVDAIERALSAAPASPRAEGEVERLREAMQGACDLLAERKWASMARSPGHNARLVLEAALSASPPPPVAESGWQPSELQKLDIVTDICMSVAELPDRTSPEDRPDMMLVTHDELQAIVLSALADVFPAPAHIAEEQTGAK